MNNDSTNPTTAPEGETRASILEAAQRVAEQDRLEAPAHSEKMAQVDHDNVHQQRDFVSRNARRSDIHSDTNVHRLFEFGPPSTAPNSEPFPSDRERRLAQRGIELGIHSGPINKKEKTEEQNSKSPREKWLAERIADIETLSPLWKSGEEGDQEAAALEEKPQRDNSKKWKQKSWVETEDGRVCEESWETLMNGVRR
jgi:hypothetical protein